MLSLYMSVLLLKMTEMYKLLYSLASHFLRQFVKHNNLELIVDDTLLLLQNLDILILESSLLSNPQKFRVHLHTSSYSNHQFQLYLQRQELHHNTTLVDLGIIELDALNQ